MTQQETIPWDECLAADCNAKGTHTVQILGKGSAAEKEVFHTNFVVCDKHAADIKQGNRIPLKTLVLGWNDPAATTVTVNP